MKIIFFLLITFPALALNAQISINTNPSGKGKSRTIIKESVQVDETKKELETTKSEEQIIETNLVSPNFDEGKSTEEFESSISPLSVETPNNALGTEDSVTITTIAPAATNKTLIDSFETKEPIETPLSPADTSNFVK